MLPVQGFVLPEDKSSHLPSITHLSQDQVAEIYQLVMECQELDAEVAQKFQCLSTLEATQWITAQATAHETINARHMACEVAGIWNVLNPDVDICERIQQQLTTEADQAWKDTNDILFPTSLSMMLSSPNLPQR